MLCETIHNNRPAMPYNTRKIQRNGNVEPEIQKSRIRLGLCPTCGIQVRKHDEHGYYQPVTNSDVFESRCLLCDPLILQPRLRRNRNNRTATDSSGSENLIRYDNTNFSPNKYAHRKCQEKKRQQGRRKRSSQHKDISRIKSQEKNNRSGEYLFPDIFVDSSSSLTYIGSESSTDSMDGRYKQKLRRSMLRRKLNENRIKIFCLQGTQSTLHKENKHYSVEKSLYGYCYRNTLGRASPGFGKVPDSIFLSPSVEQEIFEHPDRKVKYITAKNNCKSGEESSSRFEKMEQDVRHNLVSFSHPIFSIAPNKVRSFETKRGATWGSGSATL